MRKSTGRPRCVECRKPILSGQPTHDVEGPAGHLMSQAHRTVVNRWHVGCWAEVMRFHDESRAESERQRLATIRAIVKAAGMTPEQASQIAAEMAAPDPYAPEAMGADAEEAQA